MKRTTMKHTKPFFVPAMAMLLLSASAAAWEGKVTELWVEDGQVKFILNDCEHPFRLVSKDHAPQTFDMLLAAFLAHRNVKVYKVGFDPFTGCPTTNNLGGSVKVQY